MIKPALRGRTLPVVLLALAGCSAAGDGGQAPGAPAGGTGGTASSGGAAGGGGRGGSGSGGAGGSSSAATGGAGGGGSSSAATGGAGGSSAATGGGGGSSAGAGGASSEAGRPPEAGAGSGDASVGVDVDNPGSGFTCTQLVGPSPMMQWFRGGFLAHAGIDPGKWQLIWVAHHYTDAWAKPGDSAWNTALEQGHACARNSGMPDRVVFQATQWSHTTAAQWEKDLTGIVENIKRKWPGVKRIEFMASTTAPGNVPCPAAGGKNNETIIPGFAFEAIDHMPALYPGLVTALPHFEVPSCSDFIGNGTAPQYAPSATATSGPAVAEVANMFATYFAAHP